MKSIAKASIVHNDRPNKLPKQGDMYQQYLESVFEQYDWSIEITDQDSINFLSGNEIAEFIDLSALKKIIINISFDFDANAVELGHKFIKIASLNIGKFDNPWSQVPNAEQIDLQRIIYLQVEKKGHQNIKSGSGDHDFGVPRKAPVSGFSPFVGLPILSFTACETYVEPKNIDKNKRYLFDEIPLYEELTYTDMISLFKKNVDTIEISPVLSHQKLAGDDEHIQYNSTINTLPKQTNTVPKKTYRDILYLIKHTLKKLFQK